jgi:proline racemase/trans-L-3-hydroxyproline dehydratase
MNIIQTFDTIEVHVAGTPIRVVTGGIPHLKGQTMTEKMDFMKNRYDWMRECITKKPRAFDAVVAAVITDPVSQDADFGVFYMDMLKYQPMCGAGTFGVIKALIESGMVEKKSPETQLIIDTPSGKLHAKARVENQMVKEVSFQNITSFVFKKDLEINLPEYGTISVDIVYGGNFFVIVDVEKIKIPIVKKNVPALANLQTAVLKAANNVISVQHPINKEINYLDQVLFVQDSDDPKKGYMAQCVFGDRQADNSPCGTGTCARMIRRMARGEIKLNETFKQLNVTDSGAFYGKLISEEPLGDFAGYIPQISCQDIYIIGFNKLVVEENDNLKCGLSV